jgi:hypothetical protein
MTSAHNSQWTVSAAAGRRQTALRQASLTLVCVVVFLLARNSVD